MNVTKNFGIAVWALWPVMLALLALPVACSNDDGAKGDGKDGGPAADGGGQGDGGPIDQDANVGVSCGTLTCSRDEHCDEFPKPTCKPNVCKDLVCTKIEKCVTTTSGAHCEDNSCNDDLGCAPKDHCEDMHCAADTCEAHSSECSGSSVLSCAPNGSAQQKLVSCGGDNPYFESTCMQASATQAGCSCQDDWDCPDNTVCEAGLCEGTGKPATCSLPSLPFSSVLPTPELTWGGVSSADSDAREASLDPVSPPVAGSRPKVIWPTYAQVVHTPIVINLDDDNGDGAIDERDFPEIIFLAFVGGPDTDPSTFEHGGILRAIHGGGPDKGKDYFATCGTTTWHKGDAPGIACTAPDLNSTSVVAAGDVDDDGNPEIMAMLDTGEVRIYDRRGNRVVESPIVPAGGENPAITLANLDNAGTAEVLVGKHALTLTHDGNGKLAFADRFSGSGLDGTSGVEGPSTCVANLVGSSRPEIVAGAVAYRLPKPPAGAQRPADCTTNGGSIAPTTQEETDFCSNALTVVWDAEALNSLTGDAARGMCAIADVLGANQAAAPSPSNSLDGKPEVITIEDEDVRIFNGQTGMLVRTINLGPGADGGPPNVDDFDGDGFPEIGSAFASAYVVVDLQAPTVGGACDAWPTVQVDDTMSVASANTARTPPALSCTKDSACGDTTKFVCNETIGECVCLHNGWSRQTEDNSSRVTGSSVFDFNGDGAAEVIYNDECNFRVYDGLSGDVLFKEPSESRTRIEYPVVADVDNDGNAEIVFGTSNESGFCSEAKTTLYNNGLEVWGDASDTWVSARRIWNEHAYHITNVTEAGAIPETEPESWKSYQGRTYNSYRSNPRSFGVAPDLVPTAVQISSPGGGCAVLGTKVDITVQVENQGDLRIGPGVVVSFFGTWDTTELQLSDAKGKQVKTKIVQSLEPGDVALLTVSYDAKNDKAGVLPKGIRVLVDDGNRERECIEDNNDLIAEVASDAHRPDLDVEVETPTGCPDPTVKFKVCNKGAVAADGVKVRFFAGNPTSGGRSLGDATIKGALAPGKCVSQTAMLEGFPPNREVKVYGMVDPLDEIAECANKNNVDAAPDTHFCLVVE